MNNIVDKSLDLIVGDSFGRYAKYIIQDRALPDIRDGLKPVQRRILFGMYGLGIFYNTPYKKSARTVGEVIGKFHPHGDSSIYEAMVRMSQEWKNNIPLLDMHGNKGSIDGDSAAAMRYTEARLAKYSQLMLDNIKKNVVIFRNNFDDSEIEPAYLPSLIPNLLINGATGIAAGFATNIPPYNFNEVVDGIIYTIEHRNVTNKKLMEFIKGPDLPTGGIIQGTDGILESYETGKGKFEIKAIIKENLKDKKIDQLIISAIPYDTNKTVIIKAINDLIIDNYLNGVIEVRDETDRNGISIVIDIEKNKPLDLIKNILFKKTPLQIAYHINFVCINKRRPELMPLNSTVNAFLDHAFDIIIKATNFDLLKAKEKLEILTGLMKAIKILDEVIRTIRISISKDDAKTNLINKFAFSKNQAEAILQMKLYRLSSSDIGIISEDAEKIRIFIQEEEILLNSKKILNNHLKEILRDFKKSFGYERRTIIEEKIQKIEINLQKFINSKDILIYLSRNGYIKSTTKKSALACENFDLNDNLQFDDYLIKSFHTNTINLILVITNIGTLISLPLHLITETKFKDNFDHFNTLINVNDNYKIVTAFNYDKSMLNNVLIIVTKFGLIKKITLKDLNYINNFAKLIKIINLKNNDEIISCNLVPDKLDQEIFIFTKKGNYLRFSSEQAPLIGRNAAGVRAIKLILDDEIVSAIIKQVNLKSKLFVFSLDSYLELPINNLISSNRYNLGKCFFNNKYQSEIINVFLDDKDINLKAIDYADKILNFNSANFQNKKTFTKISPTKLQVIYKLLSKLI